MSNKLVRIELISGESPKYKISQRPLPVEVRAVGNPFIVQFDNTRMSMALEERTIERMVKSYIRENSFSANYFASGGRYYCPGSKHQNIPVQLFEKAQSSSQKPLENR